MSDTPDTQVLIAGGGPIGLTAAIELARRVDTAQLVAHLGATFARPDGDFTG